jgi:hypothetical protein
MNTFTLLALLSLLGVVALFVTLAVFLTVIRSTLEQIGGHAPAYGLPASDMSKIRMGVRAIEVHTTALEPAVGDLNTTLAGVRDTLATVADDLLATLEATTREAR